MKRSEMYCLSPMETAHPGWGSKNRQRMVLPRHRATRPGLKVSPLTRVRNTPKTAQGLGERLWNKRFLERVNPCSVRARVTPFPIS